MSLAFIGPSGSFETRWLPFALLGDNIRHHLEKGLENERFGELRAVQKALGGKSVRLRAAPLRAAAEAASTLLDLPRRQLAVSRATLEALERLRPSPGDETILLDEAEAISLDVAGARTLRDVFGPLVRSLLEVTEGATADSVVEVFDL